MPAGRWKPALPHAPRSAALWPAPTGGRGTLERAEEWLLILKLPASGYQALADFITRGHNHHEPEIIATPIVAGSEGFLSWIEEETLRS